MASYPVKLQIFEGPLDLLLHLIDKAEVDIYDIPIAEITDQYIAYLYSMKEFKIEIASEFLVLAATLLSIKSRMLLPRKEEEHDDLSEYWEEDGIDPQEELIQQLIEYRRYKLISDVFREKEFERNQVYTRPAEDLTQFITSELKQPSITGVSLVQLALSFESIWQKRVEEKSISTVTKEETSVNDKMNEITFILATSKEKVFFTQLFSTAKSRREMVTTFLAILELIKLCKITCIQIHNFADIEIKLFNE